MNKIFVYHWDYKDDFSTNSTIIYMYGLDKKDRTICLKVNNFKPYCYVELPEFRICDGENCNMKGIFSDNKCHFHTKEENKRECIEWSTLLDVKLKNLMNLIKRFTCKCLYYNCICCKSHGTTNCPLCFECNHSCGKKCSDYGCSHDCAEVDGTCIDKCPHESKWKCKFCYKRHVNCENKCEPTCEHYSSSKSFELQKKKRLFYKYMDSDGNDIFFDYLKVTLETSNQMRLLSSQIEKINDIFDTIHPGMKVKIHEFNASPVLQMTCNRGIKTAGWVGFNRNIKSTPKSVKTTYCHKEYDVNCEDLSDIDVDYVPKPLIMAFDLEVNASKAGVFPQAINSGDKIFQISCVFSRQGVGEKQEGVLLTLGEPYNEDVGKDVEVFYFDCESDLILGFTELIIERNPQIITGYNIFSFDIPYLLDRAKYEGVKTAYSKQGMIKDHESRLKKISWSSNAYGKQEFDYLDAEGRMYVDLLPIVQRDYKLENYKLKTVAQHFIGDTKDDLDAEGIFKAYREGMKAFREQKKKEEGEEYDQKIIDYGREQISICGHYCMKDSYLCIDLFNKLQTWVYLTEMAKVCQVAPVVLYTMGQQIKVFSQVYKMCLGLNYVVEKDGYEVKDTDRFEGAMVFDPIPGAYNNVVPFDFTSLYPTVIIAYNICYSTLVTDEDIPDSKCNVIEWETHTGCIHDLNKRKSKLAKEKIFCTEADMDNKPYRFRFLKGPIGVLPKLLKELLEARLKTKGEMKVVKKQIIEEIDVEKKKNLETYLDVLDKRQLAFKVSANSVYGSLGTKKGYLPFLPGAMCTTAMGRYNIKLAAKHLQEEYEGTLIYGDTDSNYIHFPTFDDKPAHELWDHCLEVEKTINRVFPAPMKLLFEEAIYVRYFILSKKRYMCLKTGRDGVIKDGIEKRGVILTRRDNSEVIRNVYRNVIMMIFEDKEGVNKDNVLNYIMEEIEKICCDKYPVENFIITKKVNETTGYKVRILPEDEDKKIKRLRDLGIVESCSCPIPCPDNCFVDCLACKKFKIRGSLPAHIQLAEKMRARGKTVQVSSRIEYVICRPELPTAKLFDKLEDPEYQQLRKGYIDIDPLYYIGLMVRSFDEVLEIGYGEKDFVKEEHKRRLVICKEQLKLKKAEYSEFKEYSLII